MKTYIVHYKDKYTKGNWSSTTYTSPEPVSQKFLYDFFGLHECEEYRIEEQK